MLSFLKKECGGETIISQDHPGQLVVLTTFLHKASFSMVLAVLEYGPECLLEREVTNSCYDQSNASPTTFPIWRAPSETHGPSQSTLWSG
jgi:hypothetical protein